MKKLDDYRELCKRRPRLKAFLGEYCTDVWLLNDEDHATSMLARQAGRRTLLLLVTIRADGKEWPGQEIVMSTPATSAKEDEYHRWIADGLNVGGVLDPDKYVLIEKAKVGRPKRQLTSEEQKKILDRRREGVSINAIARELRCSNKAIMRFCKSLPSYRPDPEQVALGRKIWNMEEEGLGINEICKQLGIKDTQYNYSLIEYQYWEKNKDLLRMMYNV